MAVLVYLSNLIAHIIAQPSTHQTVMAPVTQSVLVALAASAFALISPPASTEAFSVAPSISAPPATASLFGVAPIHPRVGVVLRAEESEEAEPTAEGAVDDSEASADAEEAEEVEAVLEDPEVTALKKDIEELEADVKAKRAELNSIQNSCDRYSEAGYARKVAEMDQNSKNRGAARKSGQSSARADVLQNFLPVLDELRSIDAKYEGNDFAKSYKALTDDLNNAMESLGMTEYTAEVGAKADIRRFVAAEEKYSDDFEKGTVISPVSIGLEIEGNVIRMAECVVSLGSEANEEAETDRAETDEAETDEAEAAAEADEATE